MKRSDVLIVGAGPTGLVLALWLTKQGVRVRIIDKANGPGTASRALAVQARTLELYCQLDLTGEILKTGHRVAGINLWVKGRKATRVALETIAEGLTPYGPFIYPQDQHERLLIMRLEALGVQVERNTELLNFIDTGDQVAATLRLSGGNQARCEASYLAGCDGARSVVRQILGTGFPGGTYQQVFYVADVDAAGPTLDGELHVDLDEADFVAVFPLKGKGRARLIGTVRDERAARSESLKFEDISDRAIQHMKVQIRKVNWFSTYHVHHRVTERFRKGRIFLLGDAAHIHSPAGGQGMNTGIGDAINLAWKLKAVLMDQASPALLDTYETERRTFARKLVATTDKGFTLATAQGRVADFIRTRIVPLVVPTLFKFEAARDYMFGAVSQIVVAYHDSALSQGRAGDVTGGDRLPWAAMPGDDNFATLQAIRWQVHVYGAASADLRNWCMRHGLLLNIFPWRQDYLGTGLARNAMYLLRPDTYVALAAYQQDPDALRCYFVDRGLSIKHLSQSA
ncbi:MAG: FAD-dependent monooxygenase [Phyllobacterium sp.]|uniref:FAD-dependent monooxygenase n=1 Tax=Phyllobacterium sp. TaxID=1871046 RepID=UPI0030F28766